MKPLDCLRTEREQESSGMVEQSTDVKFNVLLYSDESQPAIFAAIYSAMLLMKMPNMHLTVVQLKQSRDFTIGTESNSCPISSTSDWMGEVMGGSDTVNKTRYHEILEKTNEIFSKRVVDVSHQLIYCNPNIPDAVDALLEYTAKKPFQLIIMGAKGLSTLKSFIFGSLGHTLQNKSQIPVTLVKKIPEDFLDSYKLRRKGKKVPTLRVLRASY